MIKQTHVLLFSESCVVATATNPVVPQLHALDSNLLEHSQGVVVGSWTAPIPCGVCTVCRESGQCFLSSGLLCLLAIVSRGGCCGWCFSHWVCRRALQGAVSAFGVAQAVRPVGAPCVSGLLVACRGVQGEH